MEEKTTLPVTIGQSVTEWAAPALALMDEQAFTERLKHMQIYTRRVRLIQTQAMQEDVDYGRVGGSKHPTLLKPGAEMWNSQRGLIPSFEVTPREWLPGTGPLIDYRVRCRLHVGDQSGPIVGEGLGSCNGWETKYRWRNMERVCPKCGQGAIIKGKAEYGGGWVCWKNHKTTPGCGEKFEDGDQEIEGQTVGRMEHPDPHDLDNTILKMAEKRSFVDATLKAHALSGVFTQDMEDQSGGGDPYVSGSEAVASEGATSPSSREPGGKSTPAGPSGTISKPIAKAFRKLCRDRAEQLGVAYPELLVGAFGLSDSYEADPDELIDRIPKAKYNDIKEAVGKWLPGEAEGSQDEPASGDSPSEPSGGF